MKKWQIGAASVALLVAAIVFAVHTAQVSAHEEQGAGDYEVTFGWQVEPAFAGVYNGPEVFIHEHETEEPVVGAEKTLELRVIFGGKSKQLQLEPAWNDPGHYVAYLTPTRPGDYSFELTGVISTTDAITPTVVDQSFSSADGEFSTVEPARDLLFPDTALDAVSLQSQLDALKAQVKALQDEIVELKAAQ